MRLEPIGKLRMQYGRSSWHRPYGGDEGLGYGDGDGEITGEIEGQLIWANFPRRREDGVWTPNIRGRIRTPGGQEILISVHGQSVLEKAEGTRRAILARVELTSETDEYRWVNTCFIVAEGEIDEEKDHAWLTLYLCVNEEAAGPPAIGTEPPARFRQPGS
jgi:hypothetical protein